MEAKLYRTPIVFSICIHLTLCVMLALSAKNAAHYAPKSNPIMIELEPLPKRVDDKSRQVVQSTAGEKSKEAAKNAFLGKETRVVDRETVSKTQNWASNPGAQPKSASKARSEAQAKSESKSATQTKALARFGVPLMPSEQQKPKDAARWTDFSETFGSVPSDYVQGMKESETTALNTREFVYYSYFQRIRTQLDRAWQTILKEKLNRLYLSGRNLASDRDHTTKTVVTLNVKGEITKIQLIEESGVLDLDDAAVKAFNKAGPFPNPPTGIVDGTGEFQIRWDFILKT